MLKRRQLRGVSNALVIRKRIGARNVKKRSALKRAARRVAVGAPAVVVIGGAGFHLVGALRSSLAPAPRPPEIVRIEAPPPLPVSADPIAAADPAAPAPRTPPVLSAIPGAASRGAPEPVEPVEPVDLAPDLPPPSVEAQALVAELIDPVQADGMSADEFLAAWDQGYERLVALGDGGASAIRAFLREHSDIDFDSAQLGALGFPSARMAMLTALAEIGTPGAISVMAETLRSTGEPLEIAALAQNLDTLAPGQFRREAIDSAGQTLELAAAGELEEVNVAPLYHVLQRFGDESVVALLQDTMGQWKYYSTAALAELPDGAGVTALLDMASGRAEKSVPGASVAIMQALARASSDQPQVQSFFLEAARANRLPTGLWPYVAKALTADRVQFTESVYGGRVDATRRSEIQTTHVRSGNQNFYTVPASTSSSGQLQSQIGFIDQLLTDVAHPAAEPFLQESKRILLRRLRRANEALARAETAVVSIR